MSHNTHIISNQLASCMEYIQILAFTYCRFWITPEYVKTSFYEWTLMAIWHPLFTMADILQALFSDAHFVSNPWVQLTRRKHWLRWPIGLIRHQAITLTNHDPVSQKNPTIAHNDHNEHSKTKWVVMVRKLYTHDWQSESQQGCGGVGVVSQQLTSVPK